VVIEAVHAVVAQAAVRGPRRPEDLAGETVFQLDRLSFDQDLLGPRRRSICGTVQRVWHLYSRRFGLSTHVHTHIFPYSSRATQRKCSISNIDDVDMQVEEKWKKKIGGKGQSFLILNILYKGNNSNSLAQRQRSVRLWWFLYGTYIFSHFFSAFFILCHATLITFYVPPICSLTHTHKLNEVKTNIYASAVCVCVCVFVWVGECLASTGE